MLTTINNYDWLINKNLGKILIVLDYDQNFKYIQQDDLFVKYNETNTELCLYLDSKHTQIYMKLSAPKTFNFEPNYQATLIVTNNTVDFHPEKIKEQVIFSYNLI